MAERLRSYLNRMLLITCMYLTGMIIFSFVRYLYMINILPVTERSLFSDDIMRSFITGLRFDTVTLCYGLLLPVLFSLSGIFIGSRRWQSFIDIFNRRFIIVILTLFVLLLIVDFYYYNYFQAHFNMMIFGFWEDDTKSILKSVYTDYPLFRVLFIIGFCIVFFRWIVRRIQQALKPAYHNFGLPFFIFSSLLLTTLFAMGLRGSFGTFPVQVDDANVSSNPKVNLLSVNGVFALKYVLGNAMMESKLGEFDKEIKRMGMDDPLKSYRQFLGDSIRVMDNNMLFEETGLNEFASQNPPNVILFLMESMSNNNLYLQSEKLNVMGALQKYFEEGIVFRKFLPAQNGTINTIEALMVNTTITSIAQSRYGNDTFPSSTARPFYENNYETTFITGGKLNWRNLNGFVPRQYFTTIEGDADIKAQNPATQDCEWGVYDEYLFDHVFAKLEKAKRPQYIFALSTTNHTPFHLPEHYKPYSVVLNDSIKSILKVEEERAVKNLTNFQYSNDCLGRFLDKLKASPYGHNTIVFATGDHNNLMLFDFSPGQLYYKLSVPLVMYIPEPYMKNFVADTSRWGSHNDIFPTLYHLALSKTKYFNGGKNLLSSDTTDDSFFAVDAMSYVAMNDKGAVRFDSKPASYLWRNNYNLADCKTDTCMNELLQDSRAYFATMYHYINQVTGR